MSADDAGGEAQRQCRVFAPTATGKVIGQCLPKHGTPSPRPRRIDREVPKGLAIT